MSETMTTAAEIRRMLALRWRQRDPRGVWFWGTWLLFRWHVIPIIVGIVTAVLGVLIGLHIGPLAVSS